MAAKKKTPARKTGSRSSRSAAGSAGRKKKAASRKTAKPASKKSSRKKTAQPTGKSKKKTSTKKSQPASRKKTAGRRKKTAAKTTTAGKVASKSRSGKKTTGKKAAASKSSRSARVSRAETASEQAAELPPPPPAPPKVKTRLSKDQLERFKALLLKKRHALTGDMRNMTHDALGRNRQDASGDLSSMPIHMADLGSDNWEQEFALGLVASEKRVVREIDEALARIANGTYGVCVATGKHIPVARLKAKPWAKFCIDYARQQELDRR